MRAMLFGEAGSKRRDQKFACPWAPKPEKEPICLYCFKRANMPNRLL